MSENEVVDVSQLRHKRLKTSSTPSGMDENEKPNLCFCFEKSECVVRQLRAERLKAASSIRRRLDFGPAEDSTSEPIPFVQLRDESSKSSKLWNFDFKDEKPLPGQWVWKKLERPSKTADETEATTSTNMQPKTLKDLFRVSKNRRRKRSLDSSFRLPLAPIRSTETSPA